MSIWRYYSPYQTFMRECRYNEFLQGELSDEYCTWHYDRDWETNNYS